MNYLTKNYLTKKTLKEKVIFLDRDGTINVEKGYLYKKEDLVLIPGAAEALRRFHDAGYRLIVVTNQAGVGRGYYTEEDVKSLHEYLDQLLLKQAGCRIDAYYYCPHHPTHGIGAYKKDCSCRKPKPGLFEEAEKMFPNGIDKERSYMIGDKISDVQAGHAYGVTGILVATGYGAELYKEQKEKKELDENGLPFDQSYQYFTKDLLSASDIIMNTSAKQDAEL